MSTTLSYIYDQSGNKEYVVVPLSLWEKIKEYIPKIDNKIKPKSKTNFNPEKYYGLISSMNLDIEQELKDIREQWTRNI